MMLFSWKIKYNSLCNLVENLSRKMDIELVDLTPANLGQLKVINSTTLPVKYSDKFYNDLLTTYKSDFIKLAFCHGFSIGGVCARVEDHPVENDKKRLYIMTINVFAAYRNKGVGKQHY